MSDEPKTPVEPNADQTLDARGLKCPEPLMLTRNAVRSMAAGELLQVLATDPTTSRDLENFCRFMQHTMVATGETDGELSYLIRKGGA